MKSLYENEMKLEFLSKSNNEAFARITVGAFAAQLDPTIEELADIKTAVSEAVTNSIVHAYDNTEGIVKIRCSLYLNEIEIEISAFLGGQICAYRVACLIRSNCRSGSPP